MGTMKRRERYEEEQRAKLAARPHQVLMRFERYPTGWQVRFTPVDERLGIDEALATVNKFS